MLEATAVAKKIDRLRRASAKRDQHWLDVKAVRDGEPQLVFGDLYSEDWPKPVVANAIDTIARDVAESMAPMPAFNCAAGSMVSDAARKFADKKTKIVAYYLQKSRVAEQHLYGADHYASYGVEVAYIEPNFDHKCPDITIEEPLGGYAEYDRQGNVSAYAKVWTRRRGELAAMFPEHAVTILHGGGKMFGVEEQEVDVARWCDIDAVSLVMLGDQPLVLSRAKNRLSRVPVATARKPSHRDPNTGDPKGQFDDVLWAQMARNYMTMLTLEAAEKSVRAPLQMPRDATEIPMGPDAVIQTEGVVQRVKLDVPQAAFAEGAMLGEEVRKGSRYSAARSGEIDASIITGQGVEALAGSFSQQLTTAQTVFKRFFRDVVEICLEMDEAYWPNEKKAIKGNVDGGAPFSIEYVPARDIKGDHGVDVSYGLGLDQARATVSLLQLQAANALSTDTLQRQLNIEINVTEEQKKVHIEKLREGLMQGALAYVQNIPNFAAAGQDPTMLLAQMAAAIKAVEQGKPIEDAITVAFTPPEPAEPSPAEAGVATDQSGGGAPGIMPNGLPFGVAQGQAGMAPGSRPDLTTFLSGLSPSGNPMMGASTMRRRTA